MDLNILWFGLISVLFIGFFFLEGFDYGVGVLLPFVGGSDIERRMVINSIGPFWDGNEVWLLTAGGAIFAAFPHWYATMFSGFYLALFIILVALIVRAVAFEVRSKVESVTWRKTWDMMIFIGSLLPAILWGVAISNLIAGVPIGEDMEYAGTFFTLLTPFTIMGGVVTLLLFVYHGARFLHIRLADEKLLSKSDNISKLCGILLMVAVLVWVALAYFNTAIFSKTWAIVALLLAALSLLISLMATYNRKSIMAFIFSGFTILFVTIAVFAAMFPDVMISSLNPAWSLNIYNASSSQYTLRVMSIIALTLVPIVILYQGWSYWVFRKRVTSKELEY